MFEKIGKEKKEYDDRVTNQNCSDYLRHLGIEVVDGAGINCPYRPSSDSESFITNGPLYYDHARGEGGNVWQLALKMNGDDKRRALESLHKAAGVPFIDNEFGDIAKSLSQQEKAKQALKKVYASFRIETGKTPEHVVKYLEGRKVSSATLPFFSYIPKGQLSSVLSDGDIELTGLRNREELLILWYFAGGEPVYYCTRSINTKEFKKASRANGVLQHPIWNVDALYKDKDVVWGEGMFDCTSLTELGYGVAGEITCNLIEEHKPELLKALRWRAKYHPDWTFTICLDNDQLTSEGRRPGNEAAEKIAVWLWSNGVDAKWVKHDATAETKVDINLLHQNGLRDQIIKMIGEAKHISEILPYDEGFCLRNFVHMLCHQDYKGANRVIQLMREQKGNATISEILKLTHTIPWKWRDVYTGDIKHIFLYGPDIYVIFEKNRFGKNSSHYEVFKATEFIRNMKKFQNNPLLQVNLSDLDLEYRRPYWQVTRGEQNSKDLYNLFEPSPLLLQEPRRKKADAGMSNIIDDDEAPLPTMWSMVMDNLAGADEKEWLLNHMATYVQTLKKPRTIPVLVGRQGTGKTVSMELFGNGIGGFISVDNGLIETQFNGYLMNAVVLLDELANSQRDSNQLKNRLKQLINENQSINAKHRNPFATTINNYIVIASNEQTTHVPLVIEKNDRRYTIISGGKDRDLAYEEWYDYESLEEELPAFMLYLLSRPIDMDKASVPLMTQKKQQLMDSAQDYRAACIRTYLEAIQEEAQVEQRLKLSELCDQLNEKYHPQFKYLPRGVRPILEDLGYQVVISHNQAVVVVPVKEDGQAEQNGTQPIAPIGEDISKLWEEHEASGHGAVISPSSGSISPQKWAAPPSSDPENDLYDPC